MITVSPAEVIVVWLACFRLARWLRVDDELATMLATAVSICGRVVRVLVSGRPGSMRRRSSKSIAPTLQPERA